MFLPKMWSFLVHDINDYVVSYNFNRVKPCDEPLLSEKHNNVFIQTGKVSFA